MAFFDDRWAQGGINLGLAALFLSLNWNDIHPSDKDKPRA